MLAPKGENGIDPKFLVLLYSEIERLNFVIQNKEEDFGIYNKSNITSPKRLVNQSGILSPLRSPNRSAITVKI